MTCNHMSFLTLHVFQSYQDNVGMILIGCVQWFPTSLTVGKVSASLGLKPGSARSITGAPNGKPGRVAQSVGHLTRKSEVLGWILGLATYFLFFFRRFKRGSCRLLVKVYAQSTG